MIVNWVSVDKLSVRIQVLVVKMFLDILVSHKVTNHSKAPLIVVVRRSMLQESPGWVHK